MSLAVGSHTKKISLGFAYQKINGIFNSLRENKILVVQRARNIEIPCGKIRFLWSKWTELLDFFLGKSVSCGPDGQISRNGLWANKILLGQMARNIEIRCGKRRFLWSNCLEILEFLAGKIRFLWFRWLEKSKFRSCIADINQRLEDLSHSVLIPSS